MRRALPILAWVLSVLIALPILLVAALVLIGNTRLGRGWIEQATAHFTAGSVQLQGLTGRFPDQMRLQRLALEDTQGGWLQADGIALSWQPWALLGGELDIRQLSAERVTMLRVPVSGRARPMAPASTSPFFSRPFALPLTVRIGQLQLPRVQLGAALTGTEVALRLSGGGSYRSLQRADLRLMAQRLDAVPATYYAAARLRPALLHVTLNVSEQPNGPFAHLVHLPGLGALSLQMLLDGPRDNLAVTLQAHADGLQAHAGGTLNLPDRSAALDLTLQGPAMTPRPGLSWQSVTLQAHAHGAFTAPSTRAELTLADLTVGSVRLGALQATLRGEGQGLSLQAALTHLHLPAPLGALFAAAPVRLQGQARIEGLSGAAIDLQLTHPLISAQAHYDLGSLRLGPRPGASQRLMNDLRRFARRGTVQPVNQGSVSASLPQLAPWAALAHLPLQGHASLQGQLQLAAPLHTLSLSAALAVKGGDSSWSRLLAPRTTVSAQLAFNGQLLRLLRCQVSNAQLQASAQGTRQQGQLALGWQLTVPQLSALSLPTAGRLTAQGRVQGALRSLALLGSAELQLSADPLPADLQLQWRASGLPDRPSGELTLGGTLDRAPVALAARLQRARTGQMTLLIDRGRWRSVQLQGTLGAELAPFAPEGALSVRVEHLSDLDAVLGTALHGSVRAALQLAGGTGHSRAELQLQAPEVELGQERLSQLRLDGTVDEPLSAPRLALQLSARAAIKGVSAQLSGSVAGAPADLHLQLRGDTDQGLATASQLTLAAVWHQSRRALELTRLEGRYRQQRARLLAPALISFRGGLSVDRLLLAVPPAQLQLRGRLTPTLDLQASATHLESSVIAATLPQLQGWQPRGSASAQIALHGTLQHPEGSLSFAASGLGSGSDAVRGLPSASVNVRAQLAANGVDVTAAADAGTHMRLRINGHLPLATDAPMHLQMTGTMDLDIANAVLEAGGQRVLGSLRVQAEVDGTPKVPKARGELTLMNGSFQDYPRGLSLSDLQATLQAQGTELRLTQLSAKAGSGALSASGNVNLAAAGMPLQLNLVAHDAQPLKSDLITASVDMGVGVAGTLLPRHLSATGTVAIRQATINIPNALPADVPTLNVVKPGEQAAAPVAQTPLVAELNLTVSAPTGIFVRGRGLNAEVGGTLHVSGSSNHPAISGGFDLINGTLDMAGSTLTFQSGRLSFNGTGLHHRIDPTLDFTASTSTNGVVSNLTVGGYADAPTISLSSTPPLPEDEILARLLFGESVSQLTALQIAGIGAALVTLTGAGGGVGSFNPLTTVEHALGLNRLTISSGTPTSNATVAPTGATSAQNNSGATIEAGRYITNRIYVGARQTTTGLTQAQVQVDLTHNLKVQTTLSTGGGSVQGATPENDPGSSVGITYQFQY